MAKPTAELTVTRTEQLSPHLVRVYLGDPGFDSFIPSDRTDMYAKLVFEQDGAEVVRTYTIRSVDAQQRELAIDFVVHGDVGVAGRWAARAAAGDRLRLRGPGGAFRPDPAAGWYLLAGDESAIPAIAAALETLPATAVGHAVIEVADAAEQLELAHPAGIELTWVHRGGRADQVPDSRSGVQAPLVAAVRGLEWRSEDVQVFVHGEAAAVMHGIRPYLRKERGVPAGRASISGYWRRGRTEETFREWKRELADRETASA